MKQGNSNNNDINYKKEGKLKVKTVERKLRLTETRSEPLIKTGTELITSCSGEYERTERRRGVDEERERERE